MNENLKAVYDQAIVYQTHPEAVGDGAPKACGFNVAKFGNDIARQCAELCSSPDDAKKIMKHFGLIDNSVSQL